MRGAMARTRQDGCPWAMDGELVTVGAGADSDRGGREKGDGLRSKAWLIGRAPRRGQVHSWRVGVPMPAQLHCDGGDCDGEATTRG